MHPFPRFGRLLSLTLALSVAARAQNAAPPILKPTPGASARAPVSSGPATPAQLEVEALFLSYDYDATIAKATQFLQKYPNDARLLYFRGRAAQAIGSYDRASRDFGSLGDFKPHPGWQSAALLAHKIEEMQRLTPALRFDISKEGRTLFHVFSEEQNTWSRAIIALLPRAYAINRRALGRDVLETPVFIFSDADRFRRFLSLHAGGSELASWGWAFGDAGGLYFCPGVASTPLNARSSYFRGAAVHEFNHSLVRRITGNAVLPRWFEEGLAMTVETVIAPAEGERYALTVERLARSGAFLPLDEITQAASFQSAVERSLRNSFLPDPYCQSWSMTIYFLSLVPPTKIQAFLEEVRASRDFDRTLSKFTGLSPQEFAANWRAQFPSKPVAPPPTVGRFIPLHTPNYSGKRRLVF